MTEDTLPKYRKPNKFHVKILYIYNGKNRKTKQERWNVKSSKKNEINIFEDKSKLALSL